MNAVKLYVSTARLILENDQYDYTRCKAINNSFVNLQLSLTCAVCRSLLSEPYSPAETTCQHHVCKSCIGGAKTLKPACGWCKDYSKYVTNTQLQCLLACYKGLCQYVKCTDLAGRLTDLRSLVDHGNVDKRVILNILNRGAQLSCPNRPSRKIKINSFANTRRDVDPIYRFRSSVGCGNNTGGSFVKTNGDSCRENSAGSSDDSCPQDAAATTDTSAAAAATTAPSSPNTKAEYSSAAAKLTDAESEKRVMPSRLRVRRTNTASSVDDDDEDEDEEDDDSGGSDGDSRPPLYSVAFANARSKLILKRRNVSPQQQRETKRSNNVTPLPVSYSLRTPDHHQQVREYSRMRMRKRFTYLRRVSRYVGPARSRCQP